MRFFFRSKVSRVISVISFIALAGIFLPGYVAGAAKIAAPQHMHIDCSQGRFLCTEVYDSESVFGESHYVGHDEPSTAFYSNVPGSGNRMQWHLILPKDPSADHPLTPGKSYNFELHPAFWFGFAMCDVQSYPEQISTCAPDSDSNIVDPAVSPDHPGTAFMEMQFYPPGWASEFAGPSCDPVKWCSALNIDSLSRNPVTGQDNNIACQNTAGLEYVNFAYVTKSGVSQGPASPLLATPATFAPDPNKALFMNSGDSIVVTFHDTEDGLRVDIMDQTTGGHGSMTASKDNGFGMVRFDPNGTNCDPSTHNIPYNFHPMYSTTSEKTRTIWAAASANVSFADEIGHFDFCNKIDASTGSCIGKEGSPGDREPADGDDNFCFPASASLRIQVAGCEDTNTGFDGVPYQPVWPDGNTALHPTPIMFSSPLTGEDYNINYTRAGFEVDLPRIEAPDFGGPCDRLTGANCTRIPLTDDGTPAPFYPFFSIGNRGDNCFWMFGNDIPGSITDFGKNAEYGPILPQTFLNFGGGGSTIVFFNVFRNIFSHNPCPVEV